MLHQKLDGIGRFADETLKRITRDNPQHQFVFIFDRPFADEFVYSSNITPVVVFPPARHPLLWMAYFDLSLPVVLRKYKADLFFSPDGWLSLRSSVPAIPVIHDLNFAHYPHHLPYFYRTYYNYFFPRFAAKACRIATVSEFSRTDISEKYAIPGERIDVVYNGAGDGFRPLDESVKQQVRNQYTSGSPYFLFVGSIHPRKNLAGLIRAFVAFRSSVDTNLKLLVVGPTKWIDQDLDDALKNIGDRDQVVFAGRLWDAELYRVTASALAIVYPSFFEGFGIPVLEAMQSGVPVIVSSTSSLPEVGGDAVCYVNPHSPDTITQALKRMNSDEAYRKLLIEKGLIQCRKFSWDKTAERMWECLSKGASYCGLL